ncbi:MAG: SDR family NAD(P)-dependent oxidoreductase [Thermaurantimonas sp.]
MKKIAIITGTHRGIGHALAKSFLETGDYLVWGLSRHNTLVNNGFQFFQMDLSTTDFASRLPESLPDCDEYVLINNAGVIEPICPADQIDPEQLTKIYHVNILSVHLLVAWFLRLTACRRAKKLVINISSGAGRYPISHWSAYCSTKAALDMLSECIALEYPDIRVYSLAPGMVDTPMQHLIRSYSKERFPEVERFNAAFQNNLLNDTYFVSNKILHLIKNTEAVPRVKISLKDIP